MYWLQTSFHAGMDEVLAAVAESEFSTIPVVLDELRRIWRDPQAEAADLARVCEHDMAASARILKLANSVFYTRSMYQARVASVRDAIVRIGFQRAHEVIMGAMVATVFAAQDAILDYSASRLWRHAMAVGIANRLISSKTGCGSVGLDPFLAGLLHDMGIALEHQFLCQRGFEEAVQVRYFHATDLAAEEQPRLGFNHADLGQAVAEGWNFPEALCDLIGRHHVWPPPENPYRELHMVLRLSEWLCNAMEHGYCDMARATVDRLAGCRESLGLGSPEVQQVAAKLNEEMHALDHAGWFAAQHAA